MLSSSSTISRLTKLHKLCCEVPYNPFGRASGEEANNPEGTSAELQVNARKLINLVFAKVALDSSSRGFLYVRAVQANGFWGDPPINVGSPFPIQKIFE